jgi:hypothetical protein
MESRFNLGGPANKKIVDFPTFLLFPDPYIDPQRPRQDSSLSIERLGPG